ncbi:MAG: mannose-1-phosphate guanylyltransferase/mannose-6-phosphate isomerase [Thalassobaculales bacterium]
MMTSSLLHPVVLSGGAGTRLWPASRAQYPKQFLPLTGPSSLLQETVRRVADGARFAPPLLICNAEHRFAVADQLRQIGIAPRDLILEPAPRSTAPALAVAALRLAEEDPQALMLSLHADHLIGDAAAFRAGLFAGVAAARAGRIVTFGITPSRPETGYGYIRPGAPLAEAPALAVDAFVEKPDAGRAAAFLASGHLWNAGIFLVEARVLLEEMGRHAPAVLEAARLALKGARRDIDFVRLDGLAFAQAPAVAIDVAVMERTALAAVVPIDPGWSDIGSWAALWLAAEKDAAGIAGRGDVLAIDSADSYLASDGRLVVAVGVRDLVVVATPDAVLVAGRERAEAGKEAVEALRRAGRLEVESYPVVFRPWGQFRSIDSGPGYQVKRLVVQPGGRLSLQLHHRRTEHWVVVDGLARVTTGQLVRVLEPGQSVMVPRGTPHRLENAGAAPLVLIEVQSGDYLGEDDIVRLDDAYGRD